VNGVLVIGFGCIESLSALLIEHYTDTLIALHTLRTIRYMDRNVIGHLPWTPGTLYDWMKAEIAAINIKDGVVGGYCRETFEDGRYFAMGPGDELNRDFDRTWEGIFGNIAF